jgi:hypothetical protein
LVAEFCVIARFRKDLRQMPAVPPGADRLGPGSASASEIGAVLWRVVEVIEVVHIGDVGKINRHRPAGDSPYPRQHLLQIA